MLFHDVKNGLKYNVMPQTNIAIHVDVYYRRVLTDSDLTVSACFDEGIQFTPVRTPLYGCFHFLFHHKVRNENSI